MLPRKNNIADRGTEQGCVAIEEILSRFLDNDLPGREATRVVTHLHACASCHARFETIRAQQAAIHALPTPLGEQSARERVLSRLEREIRLSEPKASPALSPAQTRLAFLGRAMRFAAPALAAALVATVYIARDAHPEKGTENGARAPLLAGLPNDGTAPAVVAPAPRLTLPEKEEMRQLFVLHDQRSAAAFKAAAALAAPHLSVLVAIPKKAATSNSTPSHGSEVVAEERSAGPLSNDFIGSDAIPEAL